MKLEGKHNVQRLVRLLPCPHFSECGCGLRGGSLGSGNRIQQEACSQRRRTERAMAGHNGLNGAWLRNFLMYFAGISTSRFGSRTFASFMQNGRESEIQLYMHMYMCMYIHLRSRVGNRSLQMNSFNFCGPSTPRARARIVIGVGCRSRVKISSYVFPLDGKSTVGITACAPGVRRALDVNN